MYGRGIEQLSPGIKIGEKKILENMREEWADILEVKAPIFTSIK